MFHKTPFLLALLCASTILLKAQATDHSCEPFSILPSDNPLEYQPKHDSVPFGSFGKAGGKLKFTPLVNFFFRPEFTYNYKEAGQPIDTSYFNFYLRTDLGFRLSIPKNIHFVANLQAYGTYTTIIGPLDKTLGLYEAYMDARNMRNSPFSFRFGRMNLGKYGTEMLVGDDDFIRGRSFESWRLRYETQKVTSDLMWVQLYTFTNDTIFGGAWHHPVFFSAFNTVRIKDEINLDINLPFMVDQYIGPWRTYTLMPDLRLHGNVKGFRYSGEFIYQGGWTKNYLQADRKGSVQAFATELNLGYRHNKGKWSADLSYYYASGDDNESDNTIKSFNTLWQNEHRRFGHIDAFKGSNIQAATLHLNYRVIKEIDMGIHALYARVNEPTDKSPGLSTLANINRLNTENRNIGYGGDYYINYYLMDFFALQVSVSAFMPGAYTTEINRIGAPMVRAYILACVKI